MEYSYGDAAATAAVGAFSLIYLVIIIAIIAVNILAMWKMFEKAGYEGWKSIIPFYNSYCLCELAMGNGLLFLLSLIPCVNFIFSIILSLNIAKAYGRGIGFGILTIFFAPIMYLILGFGNDDYIGPQK